MIEQFWCASCRRYRPAGLRGGRVDKFRVYCKECLVGRRKAMTAAGRRPVQPTEGDES